MAATLLKAQFERSAYGCRLYCCWCAQDLAANRFWEATRPRAAANRVKVKSDPKLVAAARELKDQRLEELNAHSTAAIAAKYDITRAITDQPRVEGVFADTVAIRQMDLAALPPIGKALAA